MSTISVKVITPRKDRFCEHYGWHNCFYDNGFMPKGKPQMRLYGSAHSSDPKYTIYICLNCAFKSEDPKIINALNDYCHSPVVIDCEEEGCQIK